MDGSAKRIEVCRENAWRLGIANATFLHVPPGRSLPFPDGSFDAVVAASSLERMPDPRTMVRELARVLRPGGRLPIHYEALSAYRGGLSEAALERIRPHLTEVRRCRLSHPSALSLSRRLRGSGFVDVRATHDGGHFAGRLFDLTPADRRPRDHAGVVDLLTAPVRAAVELAARWTPTRPSPPSRAECPPTSTGASHD